MKIAIKNLDKIPFWSLPGTNIQLTVEKPGPIEFNPSDLTPQQRQILWFALARHILACEGADQLINLIRPMPAPKPVEAKPLAEVIPFPVPVPVTPAFDQSMVIPSVEISPKTVQKKETSLKNLLKFKIDVLKRELPNKSFSELRALLEFEQSWKKRKAVISLIEILLKTKQSEVSQSIANGTNSIGLSADQLQKREILKGVKADLLQNVEEIVSSIEDTDEEPFQISFGDSTK